MAEWSLAVDYGTSFTAAATREGDRVSLLAFNGLPRIPSLVVLQTDGTLVAGQAAENLALIEPERVIAAPKRRLGEGLILIGGEPIGIVRAVSAVLRVVLDEARRQHGGRPPSGVSLTHPADWAETRLGDLRQAAADAGIVDPVLLPEPVAAALHFMTADHQIAPGDPIGVYDLGGGTFDAAVLRRTADGWFEVIATGGDPALGGEDFDERVYRHLGQALAQRRPDDWERLRTSEERAWRKANLQFRLDARRLKEDLSNASTAPIYLRPPVDQVLQLTRGELDGLVRDDVERTLNAFDATLTHAGVGAGDLAAIYLVGGSSRMRLLERVVRERFGKADTRDDPKAVVALGAALAHRLRDLTPPMTTEPPGGRDQGGPESRVRAPKPVAVPTVPVANPCPACGSARPGQATVCLTCYFDERPRRHVPLLAVAAAGAIGLLLLAAILAARGAELPPAHSPSSPSGAAVEGGGSTRDVTDASDTDRDPSSLAPLAILGFDRGGRASRLALSAMACANQWGTRRRGTAGPTCLRAA